MSYTSSSCNGEGANVSKKTFIRDAKRLGVEPEIIAAILKQESGHGSFISKHAKILYNGSGWRNTNPNYPSNVKKYYEYFKKNGP